MKNIFLIIAVFLFSSIRSLAGETKPIPARSILVNCHNLTDANFKWVSGSITHGIVSHHNEQNKDLYPPTDIPAHSVVQWATESDGIMTGTEGHVNYTILDSKNSQFYFHWNVPFISNAYGTHYNTFNETVSSGYTIFVSGNHRQYNEVVDLYIDYPRTVVVPGFLPSTCGFKFSNLWADFTYKIPWFTPNSLVNKIFDGKAKKGLCGGMIYSARDYYESRSLIPQVFYAPNDADNNLTKYIIQRLFDSFTEDDITMYLKLMSPMFADTDEGLLNSMGQMGRSYVTLREEWPMIKNEIDMGHPATMGLIHVKSAWVGDLGHNHQVLAYGYTMTTGYVELKIYDPNNAKDDNVTIKIKLQGTDIPLEAIHNRSKNPVYAFFRTNYSQRSNFIKNTQFVQALKIIVPAKGAGVIHGTVRWAYKTGMPRANNVNDAFKVTILVPQYFQPMPYAEVDLDHYNGQNGYFFEFQDAGESLIQINTGNVAGEKQNPAAESMAVQNRNTAAGSTGVVGYKGNTTDQKQDVTAKGTLYNNMQEYKLSVTGVPVDVPYIIKLECSGNVVWEAGNDNPKPTGSGEYIYVVDVSSDKNEASGRISPVTLTASGADFECKGDWRVFSPGTEVKIVTNPVQNKKEEVQVQKVKTGIMRIKQ